VLFSNGARHGKTLGVFKLWRKSFLDNNTANSLKFKNFHFYILTPCNEEILHEFSKKKKAFVVVLLEGEG